MKRGYTLFIESTTYLYNMEDPLLTEFLSTKNRNTRRPYQTALQHYITYTGKTLTQLVEEAEAEEDMGVRKRSRKIKGYIQGYKEYRESMGHSPHTVRNSVTVVRNFYNYYDIDLPTQRLTYPRMDRPTTSSLPTLDDIRLALKRANLKYHSIILIGCSSGMGASEICSLTLQNFLDGIGLKQSLSIDEIRGYVDSLRGPIIKWNIHRIKTGSPYVTFSNPETLDSILDYLEDSNPDLDDGPLFPGQNGTPLQPKSLSVYYQRLNDKCGWGCVGRQGYLRSHTIRKWFSVRMERTPLGYSGTRRLLGHRVAVDPVGDTYILTDPEHLAFLYRQSMAAVSVLDKVRVHHVTDERVELLERRVKELEELKKAWELYDQLP